jgi:catechol 2,3-dioxygenase-like lactoylglutathione lyase family enzyme
VGRQSQWNPGTSLGNNSMPRGLDHIAHAVRDLDAAADLYRRLGFTVGARNRHAWGTQNRNIQLPGFFVELLTMAEPDKLGSDGFSTHFGRFTQSFLARKEGLSLLILESTNVAADADAFRAAGIAASDALHFEREGSRPDGTKVKIAFTVAFAREPRAPDIAFAVCRQHYPENFWSPEFQNHPNTASGIAGAVLVAENPTDLHIFLSAFTGVRELQATSSGVAVPTPRGAIQVMDPAAFEIHFGAKAPDISRGAQLAALRFAVRDPAALRAALDAGAISWFSRVGATIVPPRSAMGATLVFASGLQSS